MNKELKNKLFKAYYKELQRSIVLNEPFRVNVEIVDCGSIYEFYSTVLAESEQIKHYDPLLPPEYSKLCVSASDVYMCSVDEDGTIKTFDEEADEIVLMALNEIR